MEADSPKRAGKELEEVEQQVRDEEDNSIFCVWGIQKFFDRKQCMKFFKKNFGEHDTLTHVGKARDKAFFTVRLKGKLTADEFNQKHAKTSKVKVRTPANDGQLPQLIEIQEVAKPAERYTKQASKQELAKVKNTKIEDIVSELHSLPYNQQVQFKVQAINKVIQNYNSAFYRDPEVKKLHSNGRTIQQLKMERFIECQTKREGYRSKCQFTIGYNDEKEAVIGFNKGSYHNHTIMIESPKNVSIISKSMKLTVAVVQNFIRSNFKELDVFNRMDQTGFWRYLIVRESERTRQSMVIVVCKTEGVGEDLLLGVKKALKEQISLAIIGLKSLCFLSYNGEADCVPAEKPQVLFGDSFYEQKIFDHTFRVSASAFLQIHLDMCEILYSEIIKAVKQCDLILDLGCGIGTIGISVQKHLPNTKVIGIECCEEAVNDAKTNLQGYEVHHGKAEDLIKSICDSNKGKRIVAILDPPRSGFNKEVLVALRRCKGLDNLIYVACNAGAVQDNLLQLTLPVTQRRKAPQFQIKSMVGLDMFPQTKHFEALYVLERIY